MHILHILFIFSLCSITLADNSCIFKHPTKGVIDLTSIGLQNGQSRFQNLTAGPDSSYTYSFNPCFSFTENTCHNVAVCQTTTDRLFSFPLATQNSSKWTIDSSNTPVLKYTDDVKIVSISMICSSIDQDIVEVLGENPANFYSMRLFSRCACWNGCQAPTPTSSTTAIPSPLTTNVIYSSACRYHDSRYGTIDLSSVGSMTGTPTFKDVQTEIPNRYVWSYNPCYPFSESYCQNVSGCLIDKSQSISYTIGLQEYAYWINMGPNDERVRSIVYPSTSVNRRLTVQLICDRSLSTPQLAVLGETAIGEYTMQLTSRCVCWNECGQPTPTPDSQPIDWNFWIIAGGICGLVFIIFCTMISCLFCTKPKPKRSYPPIIANEKTPFVKGSTNY